MINGKPTIQAELHIKEAAPTDLKFIFLALTNGPYEPGASCYQEPVTTPVDVPELLSSSSSPIVEVVRSSYAAYPLISQQYSGANEDYHIIKEIPNESTFFYMSNLDRDINTGAVTKWLSALA